MSVYKFMVVAEDITFFAVYALAVTASKDRWIKFQHATQHSQLSMLSALCSLLPVLPTEAMTKNK